MEKLLRRWAELEPDRCQFSSIGFSLIYDGEEYAGTLLLQLSLQNAIEARGWSWATGYKAEGTGGMIHWARVMGKEVDGSTTAGALLLAYLTALEAQTTEDADARTT